MRTARQLISCPRVACLVGSLKRHGAFPESIMEAIQTHEVGSREITISTQLTAEEALNLQADLGRIFMLCGVNWDADKKATVRFQPQNGVEWITYHNAGGLGGTRPVIEASHL